jgi:hypothetical protein
MSAEVAQTGDESSEDNSEIDPDFRSGAKLAGEMAEQFNEIGTSTDHRSSGDEFSVRNNSLTGATFSKVTEKAAQHGFRIRSVLEDGRLLIFERMENDQTDPRNH